MAKVVTCLAAETYRVSEGKGRRREKSELEQNLGPCGGLDSVSRRKGVFWEGTDTI